MTEIIARRRNGVPPAGRPRGRFPRLQRLLADLDVMHEQEPCCRIVSRGTSPISRTTPCSTRMAPPMRCRNSISRAAASPGQVHRRSARQSSRPTCVVTGRSPRSLSGNSARAGWRVTPVARQVDGVGQQRRRHIGRGRIRGEHRDAVGDAERVAAPPRPAGGDAPPGAARADLEPAGRGRRGGVDHHAQPPRRGRRPSGAGRCRRHC
jgi:hypothetical protein